MNLVTRLPFSPSARLPPIPRTSAHKFKITSSQVRIPVEPECPARAACGRRELVILTALAAAPARAEEEEAEVEEETVKSADTTITDRVFLDIAMCPTAFRQDRSSAASEDEERTAPVCAEAESLGRIVIGLYGKQVPRTVANFRAMCTEEAGATYEGSLIHKVMPGQYMVAGKQGRKEKGEVPPPPNLERNLETVEPGAFRLRHAKPGTVSLCLSENDDEDEYRLSPDYRNVEFLITTGPAPCPQLDNKNIVFGTVLEEVHQHEERETQQLIHLNQNSQQQKTHAQVHRNSSGHSLGKSLKLVRSYPSISIPHIKKRGKVKLGVSRNLPPVKKEGQISEIGKEAKNRNQGKARKQDPRKAREKKPRRRNQDPEERERDPGMQETKKARRQGTRKPGSEEQEP